MKITKLNLLNFRNYSTLSIKLGEGMNIFVGDNAQGKTNILEAITFLALTKSHRLGVHPNVIMFDKKKAKIKGVIQKDKIISKLEIDMAENEKKLFVNQTEIRKVADYISNLNIIVFSPDDLEIIKGSPSVRRNLLNIQLSQISKVYLNVYNEYNKLLRTRNEYLKVLFQNSIADSSYLDIITDKLIEKAVFIYQKRKEYLDFINQTINTYYKDINGEVGLVVEYQPNIEFSSYDNESIRKCLKHYYKKNYKKELNYGMTLVGPHRDDFSFVFCGKDLKYFGSQGQQKTAILAYKLAEIPIFEDILKTKPVLLLDDIFSELDLKKRNRLLKLIHTGIQSVITTTDLKNINKKYLEDAYIYSVKNGNVERK